MSDLYIGIDGGGTKTAFVVIDENGKILAKENSSTIHIRQQSKENIKKIIFETIDNMLESIGKKRSDINYLFAGVPGSGDLPEVPSVFDPIFDELVGKDKYTYKNDAVAGWAGSQAAKPGVNMVLGTGAIAFGMDYKGNEARSSGWGSYCGDQGSGYWLGREAIMLFGREADYRAKRSYLYDLIRQKYKLNDDIDFITIIHDLNDDRTEIAKLSVLLTEAAKMGDDEAVKIFNRAAIEVVESIRAVIKQLDFEDEEKIYISYSGGVFNVGELITKPIEDELLKDSRIEKIDSILNPTSGAALMALKYAGVEITDKIVENLKG
ncbi:MAG: ROK family protein [Helcococcus sp.]|nr:ROK family protein [Helcococcus sp.]